MRESKTLKVGGSRPINKDDKIKVRVVEIPQTTNVTSSIHKHSSSERFGLKKNMVKLLHTNG